MQTSASSQPAVRNRTWLAYLQLTRPANVVTAMADILAGASVAIAIGNGAALPAGLILLIVASACLYAGGVVFNDVFDSALDAVERPERPIPSGRASRKGAALFGLALMLGGIGFAAAVGWPSAMLALSIAALAILYDARAKHHTFAGPLCMGLCRGLNLLLGMSLVVTALAAWWPLMLVPVLYIAAITAISQGEVHGGSRLTGWIANALLLAVIGGLVLLGIAPAYSMFAALPFILYFAWRVWPPFVRAARTPEPKFIRAAVRAGVLSLICLDAAIGSGFGGLLYGIGVLLLLPISLGLAKLFAVT